MANLEKVLVCEDDKKIQLLVDQFLSKKARLTPQITGTSKEFFENYTDNFALYLLDINLPESSGIEMLKEIMERNPSAVVIMMTAFSSESKVIECLRLGAYNYLKKPFDLDYFVSAVEEAVQESNRRKGLAIESQSKALPNGTISYSSLVMERIQKTIGKVAGKNLSVLITGESGTGKEYFASLIHKRGSRSKESLVSINCPAIPDNLFESELFGHEKGAFTGAEKMKLGKFEVADKGSLFLDEVADLSPDAQTKLLRVLQERNIERVGGLKPIPIDVQLITATSRNLKEMIEKDEFRADLYYRIADMDIHVPPLRDHIEDLPDLVTHFSLEYCSENKEETKVFEQSLIEAMMDYSWPGNIRELRSFTRRLLILSDSNEVKLSEHQREINSHLLKSELDDSPKKIDGLDENSATIQDAEIDLIKKALSETENNLTHAAKKVGISRSTLYRKMKKYNL